MTLVAGVDGCKGGWMIVVRPLEDAGSAAVHIVKSFRGVMDLVPSPGVIAVDIPIGLPQKGAAGGRVCDVEARSNLGARQSAVFAVPSRAAVMCEDYGEACRVAAATSDPPKKVSKQTFYLFPKVREVDALMTPDLQNRVVEVHPELAFWALNNREPLGEPKKVKSKPYPPGLDLRRGLLMRAGYRQELLDMQALPARIAGPDDLLDAAANSWSAARILRGEGIRFPTDPPSDETGLRMEIWA